MNKISFNINSQAVRDWQIVYSYLEQANPSTVLFMEGMAETLAGYDILKQKQNEPIVIYRDFATIGADTWWKNHSPQEALDKVQKIYGNNKHIWVYLLNEPHATGFDEVDRLNRWLTDAINLICNDGYKVIAGNFSAGTVDNPQWFHDFLYAAEYWGKRGKLLLSEHTYGSPIPPLMFNRTRGNGEIGGRYVSHEEMIRDKSLWLPEKWPYPEQIMESFYGFGKANDNGGSELWETSLWHGLRISRFYIYASEILEIDLPKFVSTESAWDRMPDLAGFDRRFEYNGYYGNFYEHLTHSYGASGYSEIKGHSSYEDCYKAIYPQLTFDESLFLMLEWLNRSLPDECIGTTLFTASWSYDWSEQYSTNFFKNPVLWDMLSRQASGEKLYENLMYTKFGIDMSENYILVQITSDVTNIRRDATIDSPVVGVLNRGNEIKLFPTIVDDINGKPYQWQQLIKADGTRGFSAVGYFEYTVLDDNPDVPDVPDNELKERVDNLETVVLDNRMRLDAIDNLISQIEDLLGNY